MSREIIHSEKLAKPFAPYSIAFKVRDARTILFISGVVPADFQGKIVGLGDIKAQMRQCIANLKVVLEAGGATIEDIVKLTTYVTCMDDYLKTKTNFEYLGNFNSPSETLVEVKGLAHEGQLIEIEAIVITE
jgi:enamine deaminase RidA (YjgF/YER057c/UK114 family)